MATTPERPIELPNAESLPPHLGFGTLDPDSVREDGELLLAWYRYADGGTAYEVVWCPGHCQLYALYQGELVVSSKGPDLPGAFFEGFLGRAEPARDPRFVDLSQRIVQAGNIYFRFPSAFRPGGPGMLYYPAGLLFRLSVPIVRENRPAWEAFRRRLRPRVQLPMALHAEGPGAIISLLPDGDLGIEEIELAQFIAPLHQVADACRACVDHELIASGQTHRMVVADASMTAAGGLQMYQGHVAGGPTAFAVCAPDPISKAPWKDQVSAARSKLADFATCTGGLQAGVED